jgi:hypothetical protein
MGPHPESFPTVVLDANPSQLGACLKQSYGFSTRVRNGTCCRRATQTTKRFTDAFRRGAAMKFCGVC